MTEPDDASLRSRLAALSLERKVRLLTGADMWALRAEPALGLRRVVTSDGPAGVRGERWDERDPSANVPSATALAATWDEALVERLGALLAAECRRKGVDVLLAPTVNLHRTPYAGRHFECFSEDPLLTGRIGSAYVRGLQEHGVGATVKHFVANDSETERFTLDVRVDERALRELYLAPFEAIVRDARPWAVMAAYNAVGGHTMSESPLLRSVLKEEWGFDGVVMSDWFAARTTEGAALAALDLAMPGPGGPWGEALVAAVRDGRVPEAAVDEKVLRILRLAGRVGALDGVSPPRVSAGSPRDVAGELRAAACAGFVLAANDGLLPLARSSLRRVAVLGRSAAVARTLGGGSATVFPPYTVSPLEGLRAALEPDVEVVHGAGPRVASRIAVAPAALLDGGVRADFVGADGTVLGSELRSGGALGFSPSPDVAAIELHASVRARETGEHVIGCSGVGRFRLAVGGVEVFDGVLALPPGGDPAEALTRPPQHGTPVSLRAGSAVDVVVRYERDSGELAFGEAGANLQLNVGEPALGDDEEIARAAALAADADVAVVVVGTTEEVESEGFDRDSLALPGRQDELVARVAAANPRTVVVVNAGAPVLLPFVDDVAAVLLAWFPGQEFGNALADVLLGVAEPGGRLPTTWPLDEERLPSTQPVDGVLAYSEGVFVGYRGYDRDGRAPLFPFGHGLGYTTWEYAGMEALDGGGLPAGALRGAALDGGALVRVRLRNTGARRGREVVQLYASRAESAVERPPRWLAGFAAVVAESGEEAVVEIAVPRRALAHWSVEEGAFVVERGAFRLAAGRSSRDLRLSTEIVMS